MLITKGEKILFTGDSITDFGRDRNDTYGLTAYSKMIQDYINVFNNLLEIKVYNRGVSGDTTKLLDQRIEKDLSEIKPNVVSVLIGINDVWRKYDSNTPTSHEEFINNYKSIVSKIRNYTDKIIIIEPFLIPSDIKKAHFRDDLDPKLALLKEFVKKEKIEYIPLDSIFAEKTIRSEPGTYSADGVHPATEGYRVIYTEWLKHVKFS